MAFLDICGQLRNPQPDSRERGPLLTITGIDCIGKSYCRQEEGVMAFTALHFFRNVFHLDGPGVPYLVKRMTCAESMVFSRAAS